MQHAAGNNTKCSIRRGRPVHRQEAIRGQLRIVHGPPRARPEPPDARRLRFNWLDPRFQRSLRRESAAIRDGGIAGGSRTNLGTGVAGSLTPMVRQYSEDTLFRAVDGFLPALEWRELPKPVANASWGLGPNEISVVAPSPRGMHIMRRATMVESRPGLKAWVKPRLAEQDNYRYIDSMSAAHQVTVWEDAIARMRRLAVDPMTDSGGPNAFVKWREDSLTANSIRLWLSVFAPRDRVQFAGAADTTIANWLLR